MQIIIVFHNKNIINNYLCFLIYNYFYKSNDIYFIIIYIYSFVIQHEL